MTASKLVLNAASGIGGATPDLAEIFSTHLYEGNNNGSGPEETQTITNNIDLAGEGGLVWLKK